VDSLTALEEHIVASGSAFGTALAAALASAGPRVTSNFNLRNWLLELDKECAGDTIPPPPPRRTAAQRPASIPRNAWARGWERDVLLAAPAIAAVSRWLVRWLRQEVGCRNVRWVPNGVRPFKGDRARGRARLGLDSDEPAIGFVGSFKPWHGHQRMGEVAHAVGARLVLIGQGESTVTGLDPARVIRTGFVTGQALADAIAALDVGLAPYPADAPPWFCPLKIFDYRAAGVPVVTTNVGDGAILVRGGGLAVPPDDLDAFVEAVRRCLASGRPPVRVRSWETVAREMLELA